MALTPDDITTIVNALNESDWDEAVIEVGDVRIAVSRNGPLSSVASALDSHSGSAPEVAAPKVEAPEVAPPPAEPSAAPVASVPAHAATVPTPEDGLGSGDDVVVTAPSVGVFWRASDPSADPFVNVGSTVGANDTVCIVEVMKLMNNVSAGTSGVVTAVLAENGQSVEHGTPLFSIRPDVG